MEASLRKEFASGCSWSFCGRISAIVTTLAVNALLARALSLSEMGTYVLLQSLVVIASLAAQLGLAQVIVRLIAESLALHEPGRVLGIIRFSFVATTVGTLLGAGTFALVGVRNLRQMVPLLGSLDGIWYLLLLWVMLLVWQGIQGATFRGFHDLRCSTIFEGMLHNILYLLLLIFLGIASVRVTLYQALACAVIAGSVSVIAAIFPLAARLSPLRQDGNPADWDKVLKSSLPLLMITLGTLALNQSDLWIIGMYSSTNDVALYNSASKLAQIVSMVMVILNVTVSPLIAQLNIQGRKEELETLLRKLSALAFIPASVFFLILALWGGPILGIVFGSTYRSAGVLLLILSVGQLFNVWTGACGLTLIMTGEQNSLLALTMSCSFLMVLASFLLVSRIGVLGVALASSSGMVLQNLLTLMMVKRRTHMWTHAKFDLKLSYFKYAASKRS